MFMWRLYSLTDQNEKVNRFRRKQTILSFMTMITGIIIVILCIIENSLLFQCLLGIEQSMLCLSIIGTFRWRLKCCHMTKHRQRGNTIIDIASGVKLSKHIDIQMNTYECNDNNDLNINEETMNEQTDEGTLIEIKINKSFIMFNIQRCN